METDAQTLRRAQRAFVIAPAGCGKTELIANAVKDGAGKSLVLTHTHAGVSVLKARLQRLGVPTPQVEVHTIAGWALRYSLAYPKSSGATVDRPEGAAWTTVYDAAVRLLSTQAIRRILSESFTDVYVDEYQDCNLRQHEIVKAIADILPCRLLGDPLQAIFDFKEPTVNWVNDVQPTFERLPDLETPHRWRNHNQELGEWLMTARQALIQGQPLDFTSGPSTWFAMNPATQRNACWRAAQNDAHSVVAIGKWAQDCHAFASNLRGVYTSMEELDCRALMDFARALDGSTLAARVVALLDFSSECFTAIRGSVKPVRDIYSTGKLVNTSRMSTSKALVDNLNTLASHTSTDYGTSLGSAMRSIERISDTVLYRRELWREMLTTALTYASRHEVSMEETAWYVRDRSRRFGRKTEKRIVSRTLLVKGLEFDNCVILNADELTSKELYVALTRGRVGLTVVSKNPQILHKAPANII